MGAGHAGVPRFSNVSAQHRWHASGHELGAQGPAFRLPDDARLRTGGGANLQEAGSKAGQHGRPRAVRNRLTRHGTRRPVLVTGGAGFIGSHLVRRLLARGEQVICLDDCSSGDAANLAGLPGLTLLRRDVTERLDVVCGQIFHLACPASPAHYQRDPLRTLRTCVLGSSNMLELAARSDAAILIASTSEVYGDPQVHPQTEDYAGCVDPTGPRACYDEGKRCAETFATEYARQHGVAVRIARIFNTYGPRMQPDDGRVVSNFIVQALTGQPLTVYGDGSQTRSLCYVDDLVDGLLALAESDVGPAPVNLGNPIEVTMLALAERVRAATGSRAPIVFAPLPADDPRRRRPDIGRALQTLDWRPRIGLEDGLQRTVDWFRAALAEPQQREGKEQASCA
jgi:UDP-glucuronate decarboxylase